MCNIKGVNIFITIMLCGMFKPLMSDTCDLAINPSLREGILGEYDVFPWLGVIRVHLHEGNKVRVALTGAVLVRDRFALVVAADVAKIPLRIFKEDTRAMFIPRHGRPWHCRLRDYILHPDYQEVNKFSVGILELDRDEPTPVKSICWPGYAFNTANELYVTGFTDISGRNFLEKVVYKAQYIDQSVCEKFYAKFGVSVGPQSYVCAYSLRSRARCLWDNGMVLVSNSSGFWTLVGFGIQGPGCAAPARFINIIAYLPWVQSVTRTHRPNYNNRQQSAFRESFYRKKPALRELWSEVPLHRYNPDMDTMMRTGTTPEPWAAEGVREPSDDQTENKEFKGSKTIFGEYYQLDDRGRPVFVIDRIDDDAINIRTFDDMFEESPGDCKQSDRLVYHEQARINTHDVPEARAVYRISLYDWLVKGYTCIKVKVDSLSRFKVYLWYMDSIDMKEMQTSEETPDSILKYYPIVDNMAAAEERNNLTETPMYKPGNLLQAKYIKDKRGRVEVSNLNLYVNFTFKDKAILRVEVYGPLKARRAPLPKKKEKKNEDGKKKDKKKLYKMRTSLKGNQKNHKKITNRVRYPVKKYAAVFDNAGSKMECAYRLFYMYPIHYVTITLLHD